MKSLNALTLTALLATSTGAFAATYELRCEQHTRTYVSHTKVNFSDVDQSLAYSFGYSYDLYELGPAAVEGVISLAAGVPKVSVLKTDKELSVQATLSAPGGRAPVILESVSLVIDRSTPGFERLKSLVINGVKYAGVTGGCSLVGG